MCHVECRRNLEALPFEPGLKQACLGGQPGAAAGPAGGAPSHSPQPPGKSPSGRPPGLLCASASVIALQLLPLPPFVQTCNDGPLQKQALVSGCLQSVNCNELLLYRLLLLPDVLRANLLGCYALQIR